MNLLRDIVSVLVGAFGLVHSQLTGIVHPELIAVYTALLGSPMAIRAYERKAKKRNESGSTDSDGRVCDKHSKK